MPEADPLRARPGGRGLFRVRIEERLPHHQPAPGGGRAAARRARHRRRVPRRGSRTSRRRRRSRRGGTRRGGKARARRRERARRCQQDRLRASHARVFEHPPLDSTMSSRPRSAKRTGDAERVVARPGADLEHALACLGGVSSSRVRVIEGCGNSTQNRWAYGHRDGWRRHPSAAERPAESARQGEAERAAPSHCQSRPPPRPRARRRASPARATRRARRAGSAFGRRRPGRARPRQPRRRLQARDLRRR